MHIPLSIVLDSISELNYTANFDTSDKKVYSSIALLPTENGTFDEDSLFIGSLSDFLKVELEGNPCCILLRNRLQDGSETQEKLKNTIIVNENIEAADLFMMIYRPVIAVNDWLFKMYSYAFSGKSIQDVLDLSQDVIGNFISISDSSFSLIAYTKNIPCDDRISSQLIKYGHHTDETISMFRRNHLLEEWSGASANTSLRHSEADSELVEFETVSKLFKFNSTYYVNVVMTCNIKPATPAIIDLFSMLTDVLEVYTEQRWESKNRYHHPYDTFINDLLEGSVSSASIIEERAKSLGIATRGKFYLFMIPIVDTDAYSIYRMEGELSAIFPRNDLFCVYDENLIVISRREDFFSPDGLEIREQLKGFLNKYDTVCGISSSFESLSELPIVMKEASAAITVRREMKWQNLFLYGIERADEYPLLPFDYYFVTYFTCCDGFDLSIWRRSAYYKSLQAVYNYDQRHGADNLRLLQTYLLYERKATETAAILHLHRNSIVYRVTRIEEMLGLDLDDARTRQGIIASYAMLERYGF